MDLKPGQTEKLKIHFTEEKATLLITLRAKALDYHSKKSILSDKTAAELIDLIDYDFEKLRGFGNDNVTVVRARQLDEWIRQFLEKQPDAIVLNLGCGLDTRITRINPPPNVIWFDVDYPPVMELRKQFYSNRDGYRMIESSLNEPGWLEALPNDRPAMIVADGVLEYLVEEEVKTLLNRMTGHFAQGQLAFDVMNSFAVKAGKSTLKETMGAQHKWAVDNLKEVDRLDVKLKRVTDLSVFASTYIRRLPWTFRLLFGVAILIPRYKNMLRLLRYEF